jgi:hypothetical protein
MSDSALPKTFWVTHMLMRIVPHVALFLLILGVWEAAVAVGLIKSIIVPRPSAIIGAIVDLYFVKGTIYRHFFVTLTEAVVGFLIGAGLALCDRSERDAWDCADTDCHRVVRLWHGLEDRARGDHLVLSDLREHADRADPI